MTVYPFYWYPWPWFLGPVAFLLRLFIWALHGRNNIRRNKFRADANGNSRILRGDVL